MDQNDQRSLERVAGPAEMSAPQSERSNVAQATGSGAPTTDGRPRDSMPDTVAPKKRRHRGGKKRRNRRQSFIAPSESTAADDTDRRPSLLDGPRPSNTQSSFYRLHHGAQSNTSLESEGLLDHREQLPFRARRQSNSQNMHNARSNMSNGRGAHRQSHAAAQMASPRLTRSHTASISEDEEEGETNDRAPLLGLSRDKPTVGRSNSGFGGSGGGTYGSSYYDQHARRRSSASRDSKRSRGHHALTKNDTSDEEFDVNNPPSVPNSPKLGSLDDVMMADEFGRGSPGRDAIIDIDNDPIDDRSSTRSGRERRRRTVADLAQQDVCYPGDGGLSEHEEGSRRSPRRRRVRQWPIISVLDDWTREEKESRDQEHIRAKKITEPVMVGGRLRPSKTAWHREEDDAPYRYTYFNENFDATIHSRTISELCQFGATFKDLFNPEAPELTDYSSSDEDEVTSPKKAPSFSGTEQGRGRSVASTVVDGHKKSTSTSGSVTPAQPGTNDHTPREKKKHYGPRPTFWLDILNPTEIEMKVLSKAFGIHQLTTEDIMMEEPREKVELFQNYYFVNYRSFEQDKDSEDYMEPVNIYVIVFRDGVLSFHFSMTPHPANVRRRIRQLNDYMSPSADWISYAIIDDVTDAYAPLVQQIEEEVDDIDDSILALHSQPETTSKPKSSSRSTNDEKQGKFSDTKSEKGDGSGSDTAGDMLRRVGECRKKVMSLYRLLGNKADVIKGFAKRCNEHWEVAPRSEIGLYLGDIQDHIVTMTGNLSHYEKYVNSMSTIPYNR